MPKYSQYKLNGLFEDSYSFPSRNVATKEVTSLTVTSFEERKKKKKKRILLYVDFISIYVKTIEILNFC